MDQAIARIRDATRPLHDRLDALPYPARVMAGSVPIAQYARFLRAVHAVHGALEHALAACDDASMRALCPELAARRTRLERDLAALGVDQDGVDETILRALVLAQRVRLAALDRPAELLGVAYVLEGSQLGGLVQHAALAGRPELAHGGRAYLAGSGPETAALFRAFVARLEAALARAPAHLRGAIDGATAAFEGFEAIVRSLDTEPQAERWIATALNADAGTHPVPADVREVAAALAAGEQTYRSYAYYGARYGARGLAYTRSDSAWLATLARELPARAAQQIGWLGELLAVRGMPRLLLEQHLFALHRALVAAVPAQAAAYDTLQQVAEGLRAARCAVLSEQEAQALIDGFGPELKAEAGITPREAATLLIAAVVDEQRGIARAVSSLGGWLFEPTRFSEAWVSEVARTLDLARACATRADQSGVPSR